MNNKGQSVLSEHVMIFFVVIAAIVAMTAFVQRNFEARIHDTRNFMINAVMNSNVCDANCLKATGNAIKYEYEPYYAQTLADVQHNEADFKGATSGNANEIGVTYSNAVNEETRTISTSTQLPPCASDTQNNPWCDNAENNGTSPAT